MPLREELKPFGKLSRRNFLRIVAGASIAGLTGILALDNLNPVETIQQSRMIMGTLVNLTLVAPDRAAADAGCRAVAACLDRMSELETVLSRFIVDSQVSCLNRTGILEHPHPALLSLVELSRSVSLLTNGAFDITIQPLFALYQHPRTRNQNLPTAEAIEVALQKVDFRKLDVCSDRLAFVEPGMSITLDGIAKGYIVDEGVAILRSLGFSNVLVEAGGDLVASGSGELGKAWQIGIQSPRPSDQRLIARFEVLDQAVATSGDYMQPFTEDYRLHHILNPKTGVSSPTLASATVIARSLALADALATALMVMDPAQSSKLILDLGLRAYLIDKQMGEISI